MSNRVWVRFLSLAAGIILSSSVSTTHAYYIGASVGQAGVKVDEVNFNLDEDDVAYKVFAGVQLLKFVRLEVSYLDLGKPEAAGLSAEVTGWDAQAVGVLPLTKHLELFGKFGYVKWDLDSESGGILSSNDGTDPIYGAGGAYTFGKHLGVLAEYELLDIEDTEDVTLITAGVRFKF